MLPNNDIMSASTCSDIVQCAFSLNDFDLEVYNRLNGAGALRADDLADMMGKDRSTVYRSLQKMLSCGICYRETKSIERGGYFHIYKAIEREELKRKLRSCVDDWYARMNQILERFGEGH
jgi:predicted transcriptional regulator